MPDPCGKTAVGSAVFYFSPGDAVGAFPQIIQVVGVGIEAADDPQRTVRHRGSMSVPSEKTAVGSTVFLYFSPVLSVGTFPHIVQFAAGTAIAADDPQRTVRHRGSTAVSAFPHIVQSVELSEPPMTHSATVKHRGSMRLPCGKTNVVVFFFSSPVLSVGTFPHIVQSVGTVKAAMTHSAPSNTAEV
ncbi:hypothetical protein CHS0354_018537 [Potamilus streckersoni]|uniref:Uncharacterized protein n=1 Tax=Potamilus streckersoni TaxID=2493646 RepID=A0AAE0TB38_9BIVA|nr:hypothetical protein CHS0354_018537 [Potamilus streckersoni]